MTLKKDQKLGFGEFIRCLLDVNPMSSVRAACLIPSLHFLSGCVSGFVIVGEDNTGKLDLGIFIASIVPDGPADRDGRIKPGTKPHVYKDK